MQIIKWFLIGIGIGFMFLGCGQEVKQKEVKNATEPLKIACVGDSITEGYGLQDPLTQSYPGELEKISKDTIEVKNFGIRNKTVLKKSEDPYWHTSFYRNSLLFEPDIVVILFGTNDIKDVNWGAKEDFVSDYLALIESYKALQSKPTIYICLPPPAYAEHAGISDTRIVNELIPKIQSVASQANVEVIDLHTLLTDKASLFPDKIHPNREGARIMAEYIYQRIY